MLSILFSNVLMNLVPELGRRDSELENINFVFRVL